MKVIEHISKSLENTKHIAEKFALTLMGGEIVLLNGDLGAGKTTFTKYVAKSLGVNDIVTSPTFTILKEYKGEKFKINHFDMYRLGDFQEAYEFGIEEYFAGNPQEVTFIEWSERISEILPENCISIDIKIIDEHTRSITIKY